MPSGSTSQIDGSAVNLGCRELQRGPCSTTGRVIVQGLNRIAAGEESGWHTHPGEEVGFVLTGIVHLQIQGRPMLVLQAGDFFLIPAALQGELAWLTRWLRPGSGAARDRHRGDRRPHERR